MFVFPLKTIEPKLLERRADPLSRSVLSDALGERNLDVRHVLPLFHTRGDADWGDPDFDLPIHDDGDFDGLGDGGGGMGDGESIADGREASPEFGGGLGRGDGGAFLAEYTMMSIKGFHTDLTHMGGDGCPEGTIGDGSGDGEAWIFLYPGGTTGSLGDGGGKNTGYRTKAEEIDLRDGLKILTIGGGAWDYVIVGWVQRLEGDEYLIHGARVIRRAGESVARTTLAAKGPQTTTLLLEASHQPEEIHRLLVRRAIAADENAWAVHCPRPPTWPAD